jgi:hypothetical protein
MQPIPMPSVLDPDRLLTDDRAEMSAEEHRSRAQQLDGALHESCAYARELWKDLDAMRQYLLDSLPPDAHGPGPHTVRSASPTGPQDDAGWNNWMAAFAAVTSVLAGPHGDSGYGAGEARQLAQSRRSPPEPAAGQPSDQAADRSEQVGAGGSEQSLTSAPAGKFRSKHTAQRSPARLAATAAVILLAIRGLRPRPRQPRF